jgi:hypothetical protein
MKDQPETQIFHDAEAAVARIAELYDDAAARLRDGFDRVTGGGAPGRVVANYPFVGFSVGHAELNTGRGPMVSGPTSTHGTRRRLVDWRCKQNFVATRFSSRRRLITA